jgi:nucleotide-binding universal stress UspA family protein
MYKRILVALDGSEDSLTGGRIALAAACELGAELLVCHISDVHIHSRRLREMEPALPARYQRTEVLSQIREAHEELIGEGFGALSRGYMDAFLQTAGERGAAVEQIHREGRNYVEILRLAEERKAGLVVLGALGLGAVEGDSLGSTSARVLAGTRCDVLIARRIPVAGKVVVGIDGSAEAGEALKKGAAWSRILGKQLELVSVYDPYFHTQVFQTMSGALSPERQEEVGLAKQETLHEELVDEGLGKLYQSFLDKALDQCGVMGVKANAVLLKGKAYRALIGHAGNGGVDLIVVGRFGNHREETARIGSNSEAACRLAMTNVLIAAGSEALRPPAREAEGIVDWDEEALQRLDRIPAFARPMARRGIEAYARARGKRRVTLEEMQAASGRMGGGKAPARHAQKPPAEET